MNLVVRLEGRQGGAQEWKLEGDYTTAHFQRLYELVATNIVRVFLGFECRLSGSTIRFIADTDQLDANVKAKIGQIVQDAFHHLEN